MSVTREGFAPASAFVAPGTHQTIEITLDPGRTITGRVLVGGEPAAGITLSGQLYHPARDMHIAKADDEGRFALVHVPPGTVRLGGAVETGQAFRGFQRVVGPTENDVLIELPPRAATIVGRVLDGDQPLGGVTITARRDTGGGANELINARTDPEGRYEVSVGAGTVTLATQQRDGRVFRHDTFVVEAPAGRTTERDLVLPRGDRRLILEIGSGPKESRADVFLVPGVHRYDRIDSDVFYELLDRAVLRYFASPAELTLEGLLPARYTGGRAALSEPVRRRHVADAGAGRNHLRRGDARRGRDAREGRVRRRHGPTGMVGST